MTSSNFTASPFEWIHPGKARLPLLLTVPHSGERIPPEGDWLTQVALDVLLTDVDRFVDQLYQDAARELELPMLVTRVHRYAADLNRYPEDVDRDSVLGSDNESGKFAKGFHWVMTTQGAPLMSSPLSREKHLQIVRNYHDRFHEEIARKLVEMREQLGSVDIFHLDLHSMPSVGTKAHADPGGRRADIVVSDVNGKSSGEPFRNQVMSSFRDAGFELAYNHPYVGGRMTQRYGRPEKRHHTIQIELNRSLYMNESTREKSAGFEETRDRLRAALFALCGKLNPTPAPGPREEA